ncbi:MAG TPA: hypothetical protein VF795_00500 [Desulfuromonadaceae bacterium]
MSFPFRLKKWYLDFVADDGRQAGYLYFIAANLGGVPFGNVALHVSSPGGRDLRLSRICRIDRRAWTDCPTIGDGAIETSPNRMCAALQVKGAHLRLEYDDSVRVSLPADPPLALREGSGILTWRLIHPGCPVRGVLSTDGRRIVFHGTGYRDLVEMTIPPWLFSARLLRWGRICCRDLTAVFNRLDLGEGGTWDALLVWKKERLILATDRFTLAADPGSEGLRIASGGVTLTLENPRVLHAGPVLTGERLRPALLRRWLAQTAANPYERKFIGPAHICLDGGSHEGTAIHEVVTWNR